jgi:hypothetical protein
MNNDRMDAIKFLEAKLKAAISDHDYCGGKDSYIDDLAKSIELLEDGADIESVMEDV